MFNAFLKYGITIAFLITFYDKATANSCDYSKKTLTNMYSNIMIHHINDLKESFRINFTGICETNTSISEMFPDPCGNSTANKTNKNCYRHASNISSCCQIKKLYYIGCLLQQQMKNLKPTTPKNSALKNKLKDFVTITKDILCVHLPREKTRRSTRQSRGTKHQQVCKIRETIEGFYHDWQKFLGSTDCA
ncbi:uncharacterized protein LOC143997339 [Lithobates pipiens]